jgi:hypothetical protein
MSKHTPGPWFVDGVAISSEAVTDLAILNMANVRYSWGGSDFATRSHREANAHLIAAAPELLAELEYLVEIAESAMRAANRDGGEYDIGEMLEAPRAAIAKAKGEAQ